MNTAMQSHRYLGRIAETLLDFQQNGTLCDIVIQIQGCQILAHSVILAAASPSLRELLPSKDTSSELAAAKKPVIQLEGYDLSVARLWLEFLYTGRCTGRPESVKQFADVVSLCEALQMPTPDWDLLVSDGRSVNKTTYEVWRTLAFWAFYLVTILSLMFVCTFVKRFDNQLTN